MPTFPKSVSLAASSLPWTKSKLSGAIMRAWVILLAVTFPIWVAGRLCAESDKAGAKEAVGSEALQILEIKKHLPHPKTFRLIKTFPVSMGEYVQTRFLFSAQNDVGLEQQFRAMSQVPNDGKTVALIDIRNDQTNAYLFEAGTEGVMAKVASAQAQTWIDPEGEESIMIYLQWKNIGNQPIHEIKAEIRAKDAQGHEIEALRVENCCAYISVDGKGVLPGKTYRRPKGKGWILGKASHLKRLGFKTAEVKILQAYGKRGLEYFKAESPSEPATPQVNDGTEKPSQERPQQPDGKAAEPTNTKSDSKILHIKGDHWFGAASKEQFHKISKYLTQKDQAAFNEAMTEGLLSGTVTVFKDGEKVLLMDTAMFSGLIQLRRMGKRDEYWTNLEAAK